MADGLGVAFVGIGNMGWPIASLLVAGGVRTHVLDSDADRCQRFVGEVGGEIADGLASVVDDVDVIFTMLPTSTEVSEVLRGVQHQLRPGTVVVDLTSGVPRTTREIGVELAAANVQVVDCPVSGGVSRATSGDLTVMAGGEIETIDRIRPLLELFSSSIFYCGGIGCGQAAKSLNNLLSAGGLLLSIEVLLMGVACGLDVEVLLDLINQSTGMNSSTKVKVRKFLLSRRFDSGFGLDLMVKDIGIALTMAHEAELAIPFASSCAELWTQALSVLGPGRDHTEIALFSEQITGLTLVDGYPD